MLIQRPELFFFMPSSFIMFKLVIHVIVTVLNPAPPNWIISNVITEYRKTEWNYSNVSVEQTSPCGFGGGQSVYVQY